MRSVEASDRLAQPFGRLDVKGLREIGIKPQKALVVSSLLWSPASKLGHRAFLWNLSYPKTIAELPSWLSKLSAVQSRFQSTNKAETPGPLHTHPWAKDLGF